MSPMAVGWMLVCALGAGSAQAQDAGKLGAPGGAKVFDYQEGAVYPVIATPGRITDIGLEPGESLVASNPVAAGDTVRWVIGDTSSGAGASRRVHVLIKPTAFGLATNLIINSDRRTYHLELRASGRTWLSQVDWRYPKPVLPIVLVAAPPAAGVQPFDPRLNLAWKIVGDRPPWRPLRVFDDGRRTYVEFGPGVAMSDLPPLYRTGADGKSAELINYHVEGRRLVADRVFDRGELRLGAKRRAVRVFLLRQAPVTETGR
jgi:P-type conjugative transfer protein TrbG